MIKENVALYKDPIGRQIFQGFVDVLNVIYAAPAQGDLIVYCRIRFSSGDISHAFIAYSDLYGFNPKENSQ